MSETENRSYRCPSCRGMVSVPPRLRTVTLDQVRQTHNATCPGRGRVWVDNEEEDDA